MRRMLFLIKIIRSDMALQKKTFRTRALTAVVFAVIMIAGLFWTPFAFLFLFTIIHFGCWWEFLNLVERIYRTSIHYYIRMGMMVMGYGIMLWFADDVFNINNYSLKDNISLAVSAAGFALTLFGIFQKQMMRVKHFLAMLTGLIYISVCWGLMLDLYSVVSTFYFPKAPPLPVNVIGVLPPVIVFTIWINDTMAYIVGSFIGKTPLSSISPKKTWEGTLGGIILAVVVSSAAILLFFDFSRALLWYHWIMISAFTAIAGTCGDLLESKLKRLAGVKDSGSFLPGHGGFLDRFDSLLLAIPFVWLYVRFFVH